VRFFRPFALAAILSACSGSQPSSPAPSARLNGASVALSAPLHPHYAGKLWIAPDIDRVTRLLFVSDADNNEVYVLTLPDLTPKATLTGFSEPQGMCADSSGNIWIANMGTSEMFLYSRTGTFIRMLIDDHGFPVGCAIEPKTGDLAVFDIYMGEGNRPGQILTYRNASGTPEVLTIPGFFFYYFGGYDSHGNLFVDGRYAGPGPFVLGEVPKGASSGNQIMVTGGEIYFPGFVQWYGPGNYLAVDDQLCGNQMTACIYHLTISGSTGTIVGSTMLKNYQGEPVCDVVEGVIVASRQTYLAGSVNDYCGTGTSNADRWAYPAGGSPLNYNNSLGLESPIGAAISTK